MKKYINKTNAHNRSFALSAMLSLGIMQSTLVEASVDEKVFEQAKNYTVKISTRVKLPFFGDKKGIFKGAGFLVDIDRGWIVTNAHVVSRSPSKVKLMFHDGKYIPATKRYIDPYLDFAVLEIDPGMLPDKQEAASLACKDKPAIGHGVGAFGHPWSLSFTGTRGIISGNTDKYFDKIDMLQTDAAINPGNSGGPLISMTNGEVVGINTSSRRSGQNTNFALPINHACHIISLLRKGEDPSPPYFSVRFVKNLEDEKKLIVARTYLDDSGIQLLEGDQILGLEGEDEVVSGKSNLIQKLRGRLDNVALRVLRDSEEIIVSGKLKAASSPSERKGIKFSGIFIAETPWKEFRNIIPGHNSVMVHHVERSSDGDEKRIKKMDMLYAVNGNSIEDIDNLYEYIMELHENNIEINLKFIRIASLKGDLLDYIERTITPSKPVMITGTGIEKNKKLVLNNQEEL